MQVAKRVEDGQTALFAFRGTCVPSDWGTDSEVELVVLGTAIDIMPWHGIDTSARVHAGFLARFRETLSAAAPNDLHKQVRALMPMLNCLPSCLRTMSRHRRVKLVWSHDFGRCNEVLDCDCMFRRAYVLLLALLFAHGHAAAHDRQYRIGSTACERRWSMRRTTLQCSG